MHSWREDREQAWTLWLGDFLTDSVREKMLGHNDHPDPIDMPSMEVMHALVDVGIVLGRTHWTEDEFGPTLTNMPQLITEIADGIITTYTNEMEEA